MNPLLSFLLAVLLYPGAVVALLVGIALSVTRTQIAGGGSSAAAPTQPVATLARLRANITADRLDGVRPAPAEVLASVCAVIAPFLALVLVPVPGNPLVRGLGLTTDLAAEGALLLGLPLARLLLGWAAPDSGAHAAADRSARLLAGLAVPMAIALTVTAEAFGIPSLLSGRASTGGGAIQILARVLAAAAFLCVLPALTRVAPFPPTAPSHRGETQPGHAADENEDEDASVCDERASLTAQGQATFALGHMLQLASASAIFIAAFILPLIASASAGVVAAVWIVGLIATALVIGFWECRIGFHPSETERPPLSWWAGVPTLLALASLVAIAWATRGA